ncbi:MAG: HAMP domain-containing sensor histidine kinase [Gemmatimonadaceae bacterium]
MKRFAFRTRVFLYLVLFAAVPSTVLMFGGATALRETLMLNGSGAWDRVAESGQRAMSAVRTAPLTREQRAAVNAHEQELAASLTQSRRVSFLADRAATMVLVVAVVGSALFALLASRVAGHLSRQLSRPIRELVGWTDLIAKGQPVPGGPPRRGAPEFELLRTRMRAMAADLEVGRERELEAERLAAFRETARRVAHELKNPLTPIRFAVDRLRRGVSPELSDVVEVLAIESQRLEEMARSFAQFGRLPEGAPADVDIGELARYAARAIVPDGTPLSIEVEEALPMVRGHYESLSRALSNVLINAVEACKDGGGVDVRVSRRRANGAGAPEAIVLAVRDGGCGIAADRLARIWDPYVTSKSGGTGLGLAIARQTVLAHSGSVDAESEQGKGTEIRFVLPVHGAENGNDVRT